MIIFHSLDEITAETFAAGSAIAIGKFDGVHLGHQALITNIQVLARAEGLVSAVFTFANNPLQLLRPDLCPNPIMSIDQRLHTLEQLGVDACVITPFDAEFAAISAEDFVVRILVEKMRVKHVCVGEGFKFGANEHGNVALLRELAQEHGFTVHVVEAVTTDDNRRVSSSLVRQAIESGDVATAWHMLGRPLTLRGEVVQGDARGRELGYPTANLGGQVQGLRPADGVYAGWVKLHGTMHQAAISVGANVTFEPDGEHRVEAFILDFDRPIYGEPIEIMFVERLRGMHAFDSVDALLEQMSNDVARAREVLQRTPQP